MLLNEDELICDMAEYYHIYDYKNKPVSLIATLSAGLPEDSRSMKKISGQKVSKTELMLACIYDLFSAYIYSMTKDAKYGRNKPSSIAKQWLGLEEETKKKEKVKSYATSNDFERAKAQILERKEHG